MSIILRSMVVKGYEGFIFYFGTREGVYYVWLSRFWVNGGLVLGLSHQATMLRLMYAVLPITFIR